MKRFGFGLAVVSSLLAGFVACGGDPSVSSDGTGTFESGGSSSGGDSSSGGTGTGDQPGIGVGGDEGAGGDDNSDPCAVDDPPEECFELQPSGPACGDAEINQDSEDCDDGNSLPGDGCSGVCEVEDYWICPQEGEPCEFTIVCGDGVLDPGEFCDDGNNDEEEDGCSADCLTQDASYVCPEPGEPCILLYECGDGRVNGSEECDDGETPAESDDGCSDTCKLEDGWTCNKPGQPCTVKTYCGDGTVQAGEQCDDGGGETPVGEDGCSAQCKVEADWSCPPGGGACTYLVECGDGVINGDEICDDDNVADGDGCAGDCSEVEEGWTCPRAGFACRTDCGDGITAGTEQCDTGGVSDPGCTDDCKFVDGYVCSGSPSTCETTTCGDGVVEGTEPCDDAVGMGQSDWGDGCTPDCKKEPTCTGTSACSSSCGDGIKFPSEGCDDGNQKSGDGCSDACEIETDTGWACEVPASDPATLALPVVYRDFEPAPPYQGVNGMGSPGHPDYGWDWGDWHTSPWYGGDPGGNFQNDPVGNDNRFDSTKVDFGKTATTGLVRTLLGTVADGAGLKGKPIFKYAGGGCPLGASEMKRDGVSYCAPTVLSEDSFNEWYGDSNLSDPQISQLVLKKTASNTYVFDSDVDLPNGGLQAMGVTGFFPLDGTGSMSGICGTAHNYLFSSEVHYWFQYQESADATLSFTGDDDVFVFIGGRLVVDLGGVHGKIAGSVTLNDTTLDKSGTLLSLVDGNIYEIIVFQAERNWCASNYKLELQNFLLKKSVCHTVCGDGHVTPDEECDDADDNKLTPGYGECGTDCKLGGYCGDDIPQYSDEQCDNGVNQDPYGSDDPDACSPGCVTPAVCGDMTINPPSEDCDLGDLGNTADGYNGCTDECVQGPYCGDGTPDEGHEVCDDGVNDERYDSCTDDCQGFGPYCGDGTLQEEWGEQCDDAIDDNCANCRVGATCGNQIPEEENGEECDDGVNDGGWGECGPSCKYGPRCGDGVVQKDHEECDDGENEGGYGKCSPGCVYGPFCGDGKVQKPYEECDDKNNKNGDGCSSACKKEESVPK